MRINYKPLSVNEAWQGKRFKTKAYKDYEKSLMLLLPKIVIDKNAKLKAWKSENITPYDKVKLLFLGTLEQHEELIYKQICLD